MACSERLQTRQEHSNWISFWGQASEHNPLHLTENWPDYQLAKKFRRNFSHAALRQAHVLVPVLHTMLNSMVFVHNLAEPHAWAGTHDMAANMVRANQIASLKERHDVPSHAKAFQSKRLPQWPKDCQVRGNECIKLENHVRPLLASYFPVKEIHAIFDLAAAVERTPSTTSPTRGVTMRSCCSGEAPRAH